MRHPTERILSWESRILTHSRRVVRYSILISFYLRHPCKEYQAWLSASYKGCIRKCQSQVLYLSSIICSKSCWIWSSSLTIPKSSTISASWLLSLRKKLISLPCIWSNWEYGNSWYLFYSFLFFKIRNLEFDGNVYYWFHFCTFFCCWFPFWHVWDDSLRLSI